MESKSQVFKYRGRIEDAHCSYSSMLLSLDLKIDSQERVYQFKYQSSDEKLCQFIESISDQILDSSVSNLSTVKSFFKDNKNIFYQDLFLSHFILAVSQFLGVPGSLKEQGVNSADLLCFCAKCSVTNLSQKYNDFKGDRNQTLQETECGSFCGGCSLGLEKVLASLEEQSAYFLGESKEVWSERINKLMDEFSLFSPPEYTELKFELIGLKFNLIRLRCLKGDSNLKRKEIQETIENYLLGEIEGDVKVSVIT